MQYIKCTPLQKVPCYSSREERTERLTHVKSDCDNIQRHGGVSDTAERGGLKVQGSWSEYLLNTYTY